MFGHQDDQRNRHQNDDQPIGNVINDPAINAMLGDANQPSPAPAPQDHFNPALPIATDAPFLNRSPFAAPTPAGAPTDAPVTSPAPAPSAPAPHAPKSSNDLLSIKQQALDQLSPLVGHLEQNPEEKFRTTMMMIQANDNQDLIPAAYEAAAAITDEKARAQALLDIVNEINYFTQQHQK